MTLEVQSTDAERVTVHASVDRLDPAFEPTRTELVAVLFESGLDTRVQRGENRGRSLHNDVVVRALEPIAGDGLAVFSLEPGWNRSNLGVAAFLQAKETREILGAAASGALDS